MKPAALFWMFLAIAAAQAPPDPAYAALTKAFDELHVHHYDAAAEAFRAASALAPQRADIRKNLAYTLMKTGDSEGARGQFGEAMRADATDFHVALEYAFLCYEATVDAPARKAEARRIFAAVRDSPGSDAESRATAAAAFHNIDEPLRTGIARWQHALADGGPNFSAYYELAQLAEERDETTLAAESYTAAFRLLPARKSLLLELARVENARGNTPGAMAALIAASRGPEPRAAEMAREQLPSRYPYVYEFRQALELDPGNEGLHRELAYLLLKMSESGQSSREDTEKEFSALVGDVPDDYVSAMQLGFLYMEDERMDLAMPLLNRVLARGDEATANRVRMALHVAPILAERRDTGGDASQEAIDPRVLAERSYQAGFLKDALRYYAQAREDNPLDSSLALKLGWTNNLLHDDVSALRWFDVARQSDDPAVAAEAKRAWSNLKPGQRRFRTTVWLYPLYSSRWGDLFGYGQVKTEVKLKSVNAGGSVVSGLLNRLPLHPYASIRLAGDVRRTTSGPLPQSLSESAFIAALGVATDTWHGATAWFEAGVATDYLTGSHWSDYRGGIAYTKTRGASLSSERPGWFLETNADSVYISHFNEDLITYAQSRTGYTTPLAGVPTQFFWNQNFTFDAKQQYWANFMETGPGIRVHPPGLPLPMWINLSAIHGVYLRNEGNPGRPNFNDFRVGIWYAFTK